LTIEEISTLIGIPYSMKTEMVIINSSKIAQLRPVVKVDKTPATIRASGMTQALITTAIEVENVLW
jgi:hypothetical protein